MSMLPPALGEAGLTCSADGTFLVADTFRFRQLLNNAMRRDAAAAEELAEALGEYWSNPTALRAALQPTRSPTPTPSSSTASGLFSDIGLKDSLVRLLLQCETLQTHLAKALLEQLPNLQGELEAATGAGMPLPKLLLSQFRWLEHVADGEGAHARREPPPPRRAAHVAAPRARHRITRTPPGASTFAPLPCRLTPRA